MSKTDEVVPLPTTTPDMIKPILRRACKADNPTGDQAGHYKPVLFFGPPGVSKSEQIKQFARENGYTLITVYLSYLTFNDMKGIGVPDRDPESPTYQRMVWWRDAVFPDSDCDGKYLIFWDELLNAAPSVIKVAQQAVLERMIGEYRFPRNTMMVAAANGQKHFCQASRAPASVMDRFACYQLQPAIKPMLNWLLKNAKTEHVYGFLEGHNEFLYCDNMDKWDGEQAQSSSRSYAKLDQYLSTYSDPSEMIDPDNARLFKSDVSGCIGAKAGEAFITHIQLYATCGDVGKLLENPRTCDLSRILSRPDLMYIVASKLVTLTDQDNVADVLLLSHRLTDPNLNRPDELETIESLVGNRLRFNRKDLSNVRDLHKWQLKHARELLK